MIGEDIQPTGIQFRQFNHVGPSQGIFKIGSGLFGIQENLLDTSSLDPLDKPLKGQILLAEVRGQATKISPQPRRTIAQQVNGSCYSQECEGQQPQQATNPAAKQGF